MCGEAYFVTFDSGEGHREGLATLVAQARAEYLSGYSETWFQSAWVQVLWQIRLDVSVRETVLDIHFIAAIFRSVKIVKFSDNSYVVTGELIKSVRDYSVFVDRVLDKFKSGVLV